MCLRNYIQLHRCICLSRIDHCFRLSPFSSLLSLPPVLYIAVLLLCCFLLPNVVYHLCYDLSQTDPSPWVPPFIARLLARANEQTHGQALSVLSKGDAGSKDSASGSANGSASASGSSARGAGGASVASDGGGGVSRQWARRLWSLLTPSPPTSADDGESKGDSGGDAGGDGGDGGCVGGGAGSGSGGRGGGWASKFAIYELYRSIYGVDAPPPPFPSSPPFPGSALSSSAQPPPNSMFGLPSAQVNTAHHDVPKCVSVCAYVRVCVLVCISRELEDVKIGCLEVLIGCVCVAY